MTDLVLFAGVPRSGSTVLGLALGCQDTVVYSGEVGQLFRPGWRPGRRIPCGCGRSVDDCDFWRAVLAGADVDPGAIRRLAPDQRQVAQAASAVYSRVRAETGRSVVVDTSKMAPYLDVVARLQGSNTRVVHLTRDPRGHVVSVHRGWRRREDDGSGPPLRASAGVVLSWSKNHALIEMRLTRYRFRATRLRYETATSRPAAELARLAELLDVPCDLAVDGATIDTSAHFGHHIAGNPAGRARSTALVLRPDEDWHHRLTRAQVVALGLLAGPLLWRYGYRLSGPAVA